MARIRNRRGGRRVGGRRYSKRSRLNRSAGRRNRYAGIRRTGKTFRRAVAGKTRRWKKYYFTRLTDFEYRNIDPAVGAPEITVATYSSPLDPLNNQVTPISISATGPKADGTTNFTGAFIFKLSNLPNMGEFFSGGPPPAGLFEEYKLRKVCIEVVPTYAGKDLQATEGTEGATGTPTLLFTGKRSYPTPTMYCVQDVDSTSPLGWPMLCEMNGVQRLRLNKTQRIWINPSVVVPVGGTLGGGSVWGSTKRSPWITNRNLDIQHYGLRFFMQDWPGPNDGVGPEGDHVPFSVRFNIRYYFACRGTV